MQLYTHFFCCCHIVKNHLAGLNFNWQLYNFILFHGANWFFCLFKLTSSVTQSSDWLWWPSSSKHSDASGADGCLPPQKSSIEIALYYVVLLFINSHSDTVLTLMSPEDTPALSFSSNQPAPTSSFFTLLATSSPGLTVRTPAILSVTVSLQAHPEGATASCSACICMKFVWR